MILQPVKDCYISRALHNLSESGLISVKGKWIAVVDAVGLSQNHFSSLPCDARANHPLITPFSIPQRLYRGIPNHCGESR